VSAGGESAPLGSPFLAAASAWLERLAELAGRFRGVAFWIPILVICAASGAFYGAISAFGRPMVGAVYGTVIGGSVMLFEQGHVLPRFRHWLRRLPLAIGIVGTELVYIAIVVAASAMTGAVLKLCGVLSSSWLEVTIPNVTTVLYSLLVCGTVITLNRMRELIGTDVFRNLLLGRYYHPIEEERIFLFLDLIGSTAYAQQHGDLRAQALLGAIFTALAEPVRRHRGTVDDYVGDMALVTWPMAEGAAGGRCVACVFSFFDAIEREAERWERDFGQVPRFRAALHGGSVVTAEVGLDRHKIAYFGDVVNTTGRLEGLCRVLDSDVLISAELLDRIPRLPAEVSAMPRGAHALKGRGEALAVLALERVFGAAAARPAVEPDRA
jgi:adenylate cyclase